MAWTITRTFDATSKRIVYLKCTADAATQAVSTGLGVITGFSMGLGSCSTHAGVKVLVNFNASAVAANGTLGCSGFTTGDEIYFSVYGQ